MNSDGIHTRLSRISSFQQAGFALTGFAAMAGVTIKAISLLRRAKFFQNKTKPAYEDEKSMTLEEIEGYTKSPNINLRRSAEQLLLEKVLSSAHVLDELLKWCLCGDENEIAKAATVLCVLIKSVDTRGHPWEKPYILTLAEMILQSLNPQRSYKVQADDFTVSERIQRLSTCALFELVCDATAQKDFLVANYPDIVPCILHLVVNSRCKEVSRYALFLTHQIAIQESTRQALIDANGVKIVAKSLMIHQGDPMLQRLSLQMLTVFSTMPESDSKQMLSGIAEEGVIVPTVVCLKSEDPECTYWAVALLHEFAINDVCKGRIIEVYGLLRALSQTLVDSEANQQRLLLRLLCFLAVENETFKNDILQCNDIVSRLPVFYASGDKDVVHWALVLTHDLAMTGKAATTSLLNTCPDLVSAMVPLTAQAEYVLKRLLAETLGFFCSNEHYMLKIIRNGVLVTILQYATCEDEQLKYWSAAVMLNMAMTSDAVKLEILQAGGLSVIMELAIGDHSNTQISVMAAKSLVMLGFTDKPLSISVLCDEDNARVRMNKKVYHLNKPGLNIMVWNTLTAESMAQLHYHINNPWEAQDLGVKIPHKPQDEGNLVIIVIRGQYGQIYLKAMKDLLVISAKSSVRQDSLYQLQESEMCVIVATLLNSGMLDVNHVEKAATINMEFQFPYNEIVNHRVSEIVLIPIIRVLFGTAPSSPISKVMELDLLEVLARHSGHCETMLNCDGFLDYLNSILSEFTKTLSESQDYPPIAVAHCLGALKVLSVLSVSAECQDQLMQKGVAGQLVTLLHQLAGLWINSVLDLAVMKQQQQLQQEESGFMHVEDNLDVNDLGRTPTETELDTSLSELLEQQGIMEGRDDEGLLETSEKIEVHQRAAVPHDSQTNQLNIGSRQSSVVISQFSKVHEYEEIFSSLARYCVVTLSNSAVQRVHRNKLTNLGAVHTMWSTLLCGGTALKNQLSLPVCATLSRLCCPVSSHSKAVVLSDQNKTAGLQLSADQLEIRNDTWTFESIRASHGIKLCSQNEYKDSLPMGWYYEVNIKSSSIIQIGFANESCVFQPEKGLGVGDDKNSCAFDGGRCKKWNGSITELEDNNYGEEWSDGDMISCCLSRDGQVSFWLNGKDLGVAFTGLDLSKIWFPAVSVSTEQQVRVNFGSSPFKYAKPDGYASVSCLSKSEMGETGYLEDGQIRDKLLGYARDFVFMLDEEDYHPLPSLYYEVTLNSATEIPFVFGLSSMAEWHLPPQQVTCTVHSKQLELPSGNMLQLEPSDLNPLTVGCGLLLPHGAVFFTVNGRPLKSLFPFQTEELGQDPLVPFLNSFQIELNLGDTYFMFGKANEKENRLSMAALLHDYQDTRTNRVKKETRY